MMRMVLTLTILAGLLTAGPAARAEPAQPASADRPNIVVILADDLGYADLGCYGSEIDTPNLDRLAQQGVRFTRFRVEPMCTVSRVAMLSGMPYNRTGPPNYKHAVPFPRLLDRAGYTTLMAGKWHAGVPDPRSPELFDRFFGFLGGMTNCFVGGDDWYLDDQHFTDFPKDFYTTKNLTTRAVRFMRDARAAGDKPFFMYLAYNEPHTPIQAPKATVMKYADRYSAGYRAVHDARLKRQRAMGLVPPELEPAQPGVEVRRWWEMPESRQEIEARRMAIYAAAVDRVDHNVGRVLQYLDDSGQADNTLVLFLSDNGGDYNNGDPRTDAQQIPWRADSNPSTSNGWAWVKNTPFRYYKHAATEGALASPLIVRWPAGLKLKPGSLVRRPAHITDLYPTFLELAGASYPEKDDGKPLAPLMGASLLPLLRDEPDQRVDRPVFSWYTVSQSWIEKEWKAVRLYGGPWHLYNLRDDRGETRDLADAQPDKLRALAERWNTYARAASITTDAYPPKTGAQRGWGWHRLQMICHQKLVRLSPANSKLTAGLPGKLEITFTDPVDFTGSGDRAIRLYAVARESDPVWQASPGPDSPFQGQRRIVFDDLPKLTPDTQYFVQWDPGWVKVAGAPVGPLNDGAYWWRFRTPPAKHEAPIN